MPGMTDSVLKQAGFFIPVKAVKWFEPGLPVTLKHETAFTQLHAAIDNDFSTRDIARHLGHQEHNRCRNLCRGAMTTDGRLFDHVF